jgi:membrane fusion protein (multidrug efflux system)
LKEGKIMPRSAKIASGILFGCVLVFSVIFLNGRDDSSRLQSTDDAYVRVDFTKVSPRVNGQISKVLVEENQAVKTGDLLATIDEREFVLHVANAEAILVSARSTQESLAKQAEQQSDLIAQARAVVEADKATLELKRQEYTRYRNLASDGSGSEQALQQTTAAYRIAHAGLDRDTAKHRSEIRRLEILQAELQKTAALAEQATAVRDRAKLDLSYCRIHSPIDGVISQKGVRLGAYVRTGEALLAVVPLRDIYIDAYFRETQLANIKPGQAVSIRVDAFPGKTFAGKVASLGFASNASFSPIAPHNTSSNFTKIVQRLPVRIAIDDEDKPALKVGMSVVPTIDTGDR